MDNEIVDNPCRHFCYSVRNSYSTLLGCAAAEYRILICGVLYRIYLELSVEIFLVQFPCSFRKNAAVKFFLHLFLYAFAHFFNPFFLLALRKSVRKINKKFFSPKSCAYSALSFFTAEYFYVHFNLVSPRVLTHFSKTASLCSSSAGF